MKDEIAGLYGVNKVLIKSESTVSKEDHIRMSWNLLLLTYNKYYIMVRDRVDST